MRFQQEVAFTRDFDVLVIGGGTTGSIAALAAARNGAKVALVEYYGFLGGNATIGLPWIGFHNYREKKLVVRGIALEIIERLRKVGGATDWLLDPVVSSAVGVNPTLLTMTLAEMVAEESVTAFLHSLAVGVERDGGRVRGAYVQSKQGLTYLGGRMIVDATDTGDICVMAGAEYEVGRRHDNKVQVSSCSNVIGDVDMEALISYFERRPDQMRPFPLSREDRDYLVGILRKTDLFALGAFPELIAQAKADGVNYDRSHLIGVAYPKQREIMMVSSRVEGVDLNDVANITAAELSGQRQVRGIMEFVHRYMPGGQAARIVHSGHQIGVRESRHILGDHYLTGAEVMSGAFLEDTIACGAYHIDIHSPDRKGLEPFRQPPTYGIPYRSLLPKGLDNVLIAGRAISADHEALASTRVIPISGAQGEAAGTAAAMALSHGDDTRAVPPAALMERLEAAGAYLGRGA